MQKDLLSNVLANHKTISKLIMYNNNMGLKGCVAFAEALKTNNSITTVDLSMNEIGNEGCAALEAAMKINQTLTKITVFGRLIDDVDHFYHNFNASRAQRVGLIDDSA